MELELSKQSNGKMEEDLISSQNQVQQVQVAMKKLEHKVDELEQEMLAKEKELASTEKLLEVNIRRIRGAFQRRRRNSC